MRDEEGKIAMRKAGVMGTVEVGGVVKKGARIQVEVPDQYVAMECV